MKKIQIKTLLMRMIEIDNEEPLENTLHRLYIEENKSIRAIAEELGVHYHTVNSWLKQMNIEARLPHAKLLDLVEIKKRLRENEESWKKEKK